MLLARLAVFAGAFTSTPPKRSAATDPLAREDVLDVLSPLVEKSLVNMEEGQDGARYRMLETLRD